MGQTLTKNKSQGTWKDTVLKANTEITADDQKALFNSNSEGRAMFGVGCDGDRAVSIAAGMQYLPLDVKVGGSLSNKVRLKMAEAAIGAALDEGAKIVFEGDDEVLSALAVFWICVFGYKPFDEAVDQVKKEGFLVDEKLPLFIAVKEYIYNA
jgi:hypothetical protein